MILDNNAQAVNVQAAYSWWSRLAPSAPLKRIESLIEDLSSLIDGREMDPYMDSRVFRWFSVDRGIEIAESENSAEITAKLRELYALTVAAGWFPVYNLNAGTVAQKFTIEEYIKRHPGFAFSSLVVEPTERVYKAS